MTTRTQILISGALILTAVGVVAIASVRGAQEDSAAADHAHAAMAAAGGGELQPVQLDAAAQRRIGVTFAVAERRSISAPVRAVGTVTYDETRLVSVNPKIEGWVEKLYADFTGKPVRRGEPLLEIYSPALVSAQEELMLARRLLDATTADPASRAAVNAQQLLAAARRRLAYWDIPADAIAQIEHSGQATKTLVLRAPASGIVVEKNVVEGARIGPGMEVYRIADLARVWVETEVFEKDLGLIALGTHGVVTFEAYPGTPFEGRVTYVYPEVSAEARTGRIRLELNNPELRLRPGMYASVEFHPTSGPNTLVVPRSAVLNTGTRNVVFVSTGGGTLEPRLVSLGRSNSEFVEILSGISAGDVVVASANFLIDAESNLGTLLGGAGGTDAAVGERTVETPARAAPPQPDSAPRGEHEGHTSQRGGNR